MAAIAGGIYKCWEIYYCRHMAAIARGLLPPYGGNRFSGYLSLFPRVAMLAVYFLMTLI